MVVAMPALPVLCVCGQGHCVAQELLVPASKAGHGWRGLFQAAFLRLSDGGNATLLSPTSQNGSKRIELGQGFHNFFEDRSVEAALTMVLCVCISPVGNG